MGDREILLINNDLVAELEKDTSDIKFKNFLRYKVCVAEVLHQTIPLFMEMSPKEIIEKCLDPVNKDKSIMDVYSAKFKGTDVLNFREDLIFKIKLPYNITFFGSSYLYAFFNFEGQKYITSYPIFNRLVAYHADTLLKESKYLDINTTEDFYQNVIPVVNFVITDYNKGKNDIDYFYLQHKKANLIKDKLVFKDIETFTLPLLVSLNIGKNGGEDFKNIFGYLHYLISKSPDEIIEMFDYYNYVSEEKEEGTMLVSQALVDSYNEGRLEEKKNTIRLLLNSEINLKGNSKEQAFKYINELDPSYFQLELIEEVYSTLES